MIGVWAIAGLVIFLAKRATPSAESVAGMIAARPLAEMNGAEREEAIGKLAATMNRLPFEERQKLRGGETTRAYFETMTDAERARFLELTLPTGFKQMMEAFNKMEPKKRKEFVARTLDRMKNDEGERPPPDMADPAVKQIVEQGLKSFYNDASADTKLDLAPLIDQMQVGMQKGGR